MMPVKKKIALLVLLCLLSVSYVQAQYSTLGNLYALAGTIAKPYNADQQSATFLDHLMIDLTVKGYLLNSFKNNTQLVGTTLKASSTHILNSMANTIDKEQLTIGTAMYDGSNAATVSVACTTSNFQTYQGWLKDVQALAGFSVYNLNSSGSYIYKNTTGIQITIATNGTFSQSGGTGTTSQTMQLGSSVVYSCTIVHH